MNTNIRSLIAHYESLESGRLTSVTLIKGSQQQLKEPPQMTVSSSGESHFRSALETFNVTNLLKRRPAFHYRHRKWRQSITKWQEKAAKSRELALTQRFLEHLGLVKLNLKIDLSSGYL